MGHRYIGFMFLSCSGRVAFYTTRTESHATVLKIPWFLGSCYYTFSPWLSSKTLTGSLSQFFLSPSVCSRKMLNLSGFLNNILNINVIDVYWGTSGIDTTTVSSLIQWTMIYYPDFLKHTHTHTHRTYKFLKNGLENNS